MNYLELKPVRLRLDEYEPIERMILLKLKELIYLPLLRELGAKPVVLKNSEQDVIDAVLDRRIQYVDGHFEGSFGSVLSRELKKLGAVWDRVHKWWRLPLGKVPPDVRSAIGVSYSRLQMMAGEIDAKLGALVPEDIASEFKFEDHFESTAWRTNRSFEESVRSITVAPTFTPEQAKRIASEYSNNLQLYIQDFVTQEIKDLRQEVGRNAISGVRYEGMIGSIQKSYGVTANKAKFLARQETNLLITKMTQIRYEDAGVHEYKWRCVVGSPSHPVRHWHKIHDGKTFTWDNPPQTDEHGGRKNPGQDFGCRCIAIPLVKF